MIKISLCKGCRFLSSDSNKRSLEREVILDAGIKTNKTGRSGFPRHDFSSAILLWYQKDLSNLMVVSDRCFYSVTAPAPEKRHFWSFTRWVWTFVTVHTIPGFLSPRSKQKFASIAYWQSNPNSQFFAKEHPDELQAPHAQARQKKTLKK